MTKMTTNMQKFSCQNKKWLRAIHILKLALKSPIGSHKAYHWDCKNKSTQLYRDKYKKSVIQNMYRRPGVKVNE